MLDTEPRDIGRLKARQPDRRGADRRRPRVLRVTLAESLYELPLAVEGIGQQTTKLRSPPTDGFVEHTNRALLDEYYRVKGRTAWCMPPEEIQRDLDVFIAFYNEQRTIGATG